MARDTVLATREGQRHKMSCVCYCIGVVGVKANIIDMVSGFMELKA
jgi:hypothetical protein